MIIREYEDRDSLGWVRCRVLSFLDTAYFDNVLREKEKYNNPSVELVAEIDNKIVGLIDVEYEVEKGTVCYYTDELGAVIWHLAVLPEYRNRGIATQLLNRAIEILKEKDIKRIEAWTRDDKWVNDWYLSRGFRLKEEYLHVYGDRKECNEIASPKIKDLSICNFFAHYLGENKDEIKNKFKRVHECRMYELIL
ncbi:MAG: GNAT family N-acetyltransferase [Tissierellia bacterium]|nr:GNAT family N-acetyltransferase [Tissierellia bacterium]